MYNRTKGILYIIGCAVTGILMAGSVDALASYPKGYYNSLNGKCGAELVTALKNLAKGHKVISYGDATWRAFKSTDVKTVNGIEYWWDMYSNNLVKVSSGHGGLNIEHSVANSWWEGVHNDAYKDIVHLNPSDATANNRKSNYPLGEVATMKWENGVTFVGSPVSGQGGGSDYVYEPADEYKGDFARVFMYMFTAYRDMAWGTRFTWMYDTSDPLMLKPWARDLVLRWSASDAVSQKERDRNDGIYKEQNNRNPFIDLPDLADHIWGSKNTVPYKIEGAPDIPEDPGNPENEKVYSWLNSTSSSIDSGWEFENTDLPEALSYVWQWKSHNNKNYYLCGSAYKDDTPYAAEAIAWSPVIDMENVEKATFTFDHAARFQKTLRDLCKVVVLNMDVNAGADGYISTCEIPSWPQADTWTFSNSGTIEIPAASIANSHIRVGFLYKSGVAGADTWEINNAKLVLKTRPSGIKEIGDGSDTDDSCLVEVWGNNIIAPEGAVIFDLNGRRVNGENLGRGVYIVTKPTFRKAVKVMVK